jgi:hypothetical protein
MTHVLGIHMVICVHAVSPELLGLFATNAKLSDLNGVSRCAHVFNKQFMRLLTLRFEADASQLRSMKTKCALLCGGSSPR